MDERWRALWRDWDGSPGARWSRQNAYRVGLPLAVVGLVAMLVLTHWVAAGFMVVFIATVLRAEYERRGRLSVVCSCASVRVGVRDVSLLWRHS
jgi:Flp pilus assembly protein TadB